MAIHLDLAAWKESRGASEPISRRNRVREEGGSASAEAQDLGEQPSWNRQLGKLERNLPNVPDQLRADLDQHSQQCSERQLIDRFTQHMVALLAREQKPQQGSFSNTHLSTSALPPKADVSVTSVGLPLVTQPV